MNIHHVGIVITSDEEIPQWRDLFGLSEIARDHVPAYDCLCVFLTDERGLRVELILAPPGGGPRKLKPGLHHIAFCVDSLDAACRDLAQRNMPPVEPAPVRGAFGLMINFLSPLHTRGVRVELVQEPADWPNCRGPQ